MGWWDTYRMRRRLRTRARTAEKLYDEHLDGIEEQLDSRGVATGDPNVEDSYWVARSQLLVHEAVRWDIDLPPFSDAASWEVWHTPDAPVRYLSVQHQRTIERKLRAAKKEHVAWWAQIVANVGSVIVGVLGLVVALVALLIGRP